MRSVPVLMKPAANRWFLPPLFTIGMIISYGWGSYATEMLKEKHLTVKIFTQRVGRNNLTLRTRVKILTLETIGFSRSVELHEKIIGAFIEYTYSIKLSYNSFLQHP